MIIATRSKQGFVVPLAQSFFSATDNPVKGAKWPWGSIGGELQVDS